MMGLLLGTVVVKPSFSANPLKELFSAYGSVWVTNFKSVPVPSMRRPHCQLRVPLAFFNLFPVGKGLPDRTQIRFWRRWTLEPNLFRHPWTLLGGSGERGGLTGVEVMVGSVGVRTRYGCCRPLGLWKTEIYLLWLGEPCDVSRWNEWFEFGPVLVGGRNEKRLADAVDKLEAEGIEAYGKTVDIADRASLEEFAAYAVSIAPLGNVVNAAGVDAGGGELIVKINMLGTVNFVEAFFPYLEKGAALVNYSSITGYFVQPTPEEMEIWNNPNDSDFVARAKAAIDAREVPERMRLMGDDYRYYPISKTFTQYYTRANTLRFGKKGCRIFSIAPGAFDTPMLREASDDAVEGIALGTAFGRLGDPDEMAEFIVRLLEPGLEYLTGVDLILDGGKFGMTMAKQLD